MVIEIKYIIKLLKKLIFSFLLLFGLNVMIKALGIIIPINVYNVGLITLLGISGLISLIIIKLFIL